MSYKVGKLWSQNREMEAQEVLGPAGLGAASELLHGGVRFSWEVTALFSACLVASLLPQRPEVTGGHPSYTFCTHPQAAQS